MPIDLTTFTDDGLRHVLQEAHKDKFTCRVALLAGVKKFHGEKLTVQAQLDADLQTIKDVTEELTRRGVPIPPVLSKR
jgi:hypothetical protein